jgi:hypothetical protein
LGAAVITNTGQNAHTGKRWPWEATKDMNHTDTMRRLEYFELILGARTPATVDAAVTAVNTEAKANAVLEVADAAVKAADAVGKPAAVAEAATARQAAVDATAALSAPFHALDADIVAAEQTVIRNWNAKTKIPEACNPAEMLLLRDTGKALSKQIIAARNMRGGAVGWFFDDVLTEGPHYSFHKFQMFVWTLVSGVIFISSVIDNWAVPDFDTTMLALMGISSGTYLGFKLPPARSATA